MVGCKSILKCISHFVSVFFLSVCVCSIVMLIMRGIQLESQQILQILSKYLIKALVLKELVGMCR